MFNIKHTFVIQYPTKRWGFAGSIPTTLGTEAPATTSDVMIQRAHRGANGELLTWKFPSFETEAEARDFAAARGVETR
jgi:hypothetical protein